jgi:hypothetical protein
MRPSVAASHNVIHRKFTLRAERLPLPARVPATLKKNAPMKPLLYLHLFLQRPDLLVRGCKLYISGAVFDLKLRKALLHLRRLESQLVIPNLQYGGRAMLRNQLINAIEWFHVICGALTPNEKS